MRKNKKGISLIVLMITIVVMITLAGVIILNINNSGIINKASGAVQASDLAEVKHLASLKWSEAYVGKGMREQSDLEKYVMDELEKEVKDMSPYEVVVTTSGVDVYLRGTPTLALDKEKITGTIKYGVVSEIGILEAKTNCKSSDLTWSVEPVDCGVVIENYPDDPNKKIIKASKLVSNAKVIVTYSKDNTVSDTCLVTLKAKEISFKITRTGYGETYVYNVKAHDGMTLTDWAQSSYDTVNITSVWGIHENSVNYLYSGDKNAIIHDGDNFVFQWDGWSPPKPIG